MTRPAPSPLNNVITIDDEWIKNHIDVEPSPDAYDDGVIVTLKPARGLTTGRSQLQPT